MMQTENLDNREQGGAESEWLTPLASAQVAHVPVRIIYAAVRAGACRAARVGGKKQIRIKRAWLDAWLESLAARQ